MHPRWCKISGINSINEVGISTGYGMFSPCPDLHKSFGSWVASIINKIGPNLPVIHGVITPINGFING